LTVAYTQGWELMKSMGECYGSSTNMSTPLVSCPFREKWYPFTPVPVIILLYTFTKEINGGMLW